MGDSDVNVEHIVEIEASTLGQDIVLERLDLAGLLQEDDLATVLAVNANAWKIQIKPV